jgi:uncharacterized membrane protein
MSVPVAGRVIPRYAKNPCALDCSAGDERKALVCGPPKALSMNADFTFSKARFTAFSDAVFAIAITLLVLKFALLPLPPRPTDAQQFAAVIGMWPQILVYFIGFGTIGIVWLNHHAMFRYVTKVTHKMLIANLLLLSLVSLIPLPTEALEKVGITRVTVMLYGLTLYAILWAYVILYLQVLAAHPGAPLRLPVEALIGYPLAMLVGYFLPIAGVIAYALLALFAMLPGRVESIAVRPTGATDPPEESA